jgi:hypothetical protein
MVKQETGGQRTDGPKKTANFFRGTNFNSLNFYLIFFQRNLRYADA